MGLGHGVEFMGFWDYGEVVRFCITSMTINNFINCQKSFNFTDSRRDEFKKNENCEAIIY